MGGKHKKFDKTIIIVLAGGEGGRMNTTLPKVLIPLAGKPLISHLLESIAESGVCKTPAIVVGYKKQKVIKTLGDKYIYIDQGKPLGTGHAVAVCKEKLESKYKNVLVLYGDMPFLSPESINRIIDKYQEQKSTLTMATVLLPHFRGRHRVFKHFGRIVRDNSNKICGIVEFKDATPPQRKTKEVNPGYMCFDAKWLWENIDTLKNNNKQKEYYLTDMVEKVVRSGSISSIKVDPMEALGVNTKEQLLFCEKVWKENTKRDKGATD